MTPFVLQRMERIAVMLLLVSSLAVRGVSSKPNTRHVEGAELIIEEPCPPCEVLFGKLERTGRDGKLAQDVRVQERGEPKSGTSVLYAWTTSTLMHACDYLQDLFGQQSCRMETHDEKGSNGEGASSHSHKTMAIFEPSLGGADARCSCETIDRVSITTSATLKHKLPVDNSCTFSHGVGIGVGNEESDGSPSGPPCTFADGAHVTNHGELWRCMHESHCEINDDWLQMAIFRDPRPGIVSTFFHLEVHANEDLGDLDAFVARELPILCQWLAIRYILFVGILAEQSSELVAPRTARAIRCRAVSRPRLS